MLSLPQCNNEATYCLGSQPPELEDRQQDEAPIIQG